MKRNRVRHFVACLSFLALATSLLNAQTNVVTWHYDIARDGLNSNETVLTQANVNPTQFGKLCSAVFDGQVYGEPLVVVTGGINVVYVATMNGSLYSVNGTNCTQINYLSLLQANEKAPACADIGGSACHTVSPILGILGTPVIDPVTNTIYLVSESESTAGTCSTMKVNACFIHRLHALDLTTFAEKFGGPAVISGSYQLATFTSKNHIQRPGLLLLNGVMSNGDNGLYIAFSEMDGTGIPGKSIPRGWIFNYDAQNLSAPPAYVWSSTPSGEGGGMWMAGAGLAAGVDSPGGNTYLYVSTGDGDFNVNTGGMDYGDSFVKLTTTLSTVPNGFFTPFGQACMNPSDGDFGSGGVMLMPDIGSTYYGVAQGKDKNIYVMDLSNPGGFTAPTNTTCPATGTNANVEYFLGGSAHQYFSTPVMWSSSIFYAPMNASIVKYSVSQVTPPTCTPGPICQNNTYKTGVTFQYGTNMSISSSAQNTGTAILWAANGNGWPSTVTPATAVLYAFDAEHTSLPHNIPQLWSSTKCPTRDKPGNATKFVVPTVANGTVYLTSMDPTDSTNTRGELDVFGATSATCN